MEREFIRHLRETGTVYIQSLFFESEEHYNSVLLEYYQHGKIPGTNRHFRYDAGNTSTMTQDHIHVLINRNRELYALNRDGSYHHSASMRLGRREKEFFQDRGFILPREEQFNICQLNPQNTYCQIKNWYYDPEVQVLNESDVLLIVELLNNQGIVYEREVRGIDETLLRHRELELTEMFNALCAGNSHAVAGLDMQSEGYIYYLYRPDRVSDRNDIRRIYESRR